MPHEKNLLERDFASCTDCGVQNELLAVNTKDTVYIMIKSPWLCFAAIKEDGSNKSLVYPNFSG